MLLPAEHGADIADGRYDDIQDSRGVERSQQPGCGAWISGQRDLGALETSQGVYDFSVLDAILTQLKTKFNKPKRLVVYLWLYYNGALSSGDDRSFRITSSRTALTAQAL